MIEQVSADTYLFTDETGSQGLHTRSAALLVRWVVGLDARLRMESPRGSPRGAHRRGEAPPRRGPPARALILR